jgi:hypothetical protein
MQIHAKMGQPASMIWADMIAFVYRVILLNSFKLQSSMILKYRISSILSPGAYKFQIP